MTPATDTECYSWQFRALTLLRTLMDRAVSQKLPPLRWTIGTTGELHGQCTGGDRRMVFTRWRDALGAPNEDLERLDGTRLRATWNRIEHVQVTLTADLRDEEEQ
jgi:hypothetical protein